MPRVIRGNRICTVDVPTDPTWTTEDRSRYCTLVARFPNTLPDIVQCWVWKVKVPGLRYDEDTEAVLSKMMG